MTLKLALKSPLALFLTFSQSLHFLQQSYLPQDSHKKSHGDAKPDSRWHGGGCVSSDSFACEENSPPKVTALKRTVKYTVILDLWVILIEACQEDTPSHQISFFLNALV